MHTVQLKKHGAKPARHRHPWIFSGAIASVDGEPAPGELVTVVDGAGGFVCTGYYNAASRIRVRALEWNEGVAVDDAWWRRRLERAVAARAALAADPRTTAYRLVHAEADGLPGLVVDRYGDLLVVQLLTAGVESARAVILDALLRGLAPAAVFERSDTASRAREGLAPRVETVAGEVPERVEIVENGLGFDVDLAGGQKTGFYLDQRGNRAAVAALAGGRRVLDAFAYTGGFAAYAVAAGAAHVTLVESSAGALDLARSNLARVGAAEDAVELVQDDVFERLRTMRTAGQRFDVVVLDPPKFAVSRHQVERALRGYKDINMLAMELLEPGGLLATFSCSGAVDIAAFTLAVSWAALDAGRDVQIIRRLSQGLDHPVLTSFPESEYLKGLVCRVW